MQIPKTIHQFWFTNNTPPRWMKGWEEKHEGWNYHLWHKPELALEERTRFILSTLLQHGGIFINADSECLDALPDALLKHEFFACVENEQVRPGLVSNLIFGSIPQHPILKKLLEPSQEFTSTHFTSLIRQYEVLNKPVTLLPSYTFFPIHYTGLTYSGGGKTHALQHWSTEEIFQRIYHYNIWGDSETVSGEGSTLKMTAAFRDEIPKLFHAFGIKSLLDAPCGDFHWMNEVDLGSVNYIGLDIVPDLIKENQKQYDAAQRQFIYGDLIRDSLPKVDLIFCRDCLIHFSYEDIFAALQNFKKSGASYLLTTTFTQLEQNCNIPTGGWRPINLQQAPFNFPRPLATLYENYPGYADKALCLWKLT